MKKIAATIGLLFALFGWLTIWPALLSAITDPVFPWDEFVSASGLQVIAGFGAIIAVVFQSFFTAKHMTKMQNDQRKNIEAELNERKQSLVYRLVLPTVFIKNYTQHIIDQYPWFSRPGAVPGIVAGQMAIENFTDGEKFSAEIYLLGPVICKEYAQMFYFVDLFNNQISGAAQYVASHQVTPEVADENVMRVLVSARDCSANLTRLLSELHDGPGHSAAPLASSAPNNGSGAD